MQAATAAFREREVTATGALSVSNSIVTRELAKGKHAGMGS